MSAASQLAVDGVLAASLAVATVYGALIALEAVRYGMRKVRDIMHFDR